MQYMLLIYDDEQEFEALPPEQREPIFQEYMALVGDLGSKYVTGAPLAPTTAATTVRVRDAEQLVTDGPFAETKEQLGGYFLVDVESLDEALEIAARIPGARFGSVEVRPVIQERREAVA